MLQTFRLHGSRAMPDGKTQPLDPCEIRHDFGDGEVCLKCGVPRPRSPQEIYRLERMKRNLPLQEYRADGKRSQKHDSSGTWLWCPKCKCEVVLVKPSHTKKRKAHCTQCTYEWYTSSKEAFGGFRTIEVRG